jgi:transcriptional regulator with XRE-family HTH domain
MLTLDAYFALDDAKSPALVASEAGISESTLSRIRSGKQNTTRSVLRAIIAATGGQVSADSLLGLHGVHDNTKLSPPSNPAANDPAANAAADAAVCSDGGRA